MISNSGLRIVIPGVTFARNVGVVAYPVPDQLEGLFYLGSNQASSIRNHVAGKPDGSISVAPISYGDGFVHLNGNLSFLQTSAYDTTNDMTIIAVVNNMENTGPIVSNNNGGSAGFTELVLSQTGQVALQTGTNSLVAERNVANKFSMIAAVIRGTAKQITVSQAGFLYPNVTGSTFTRTRDETQAFRVGAYASDINNSAMVQKIGMVAIHKKALSAAEIAKVYAYLKAYFSKRSIVI